MELDEFLFNVTGNSPCMLIAHSMGGLIAKNYAYQYPDKIKSILFVESLHKDQFLFNPSFVKQIKVFNSMLSIFHQLKPTGLPTLLLDLKIMPFFSKFVGSSLKEDQREFKQLVLNNFKQMRMEMTSIKQLAEATPGGVDLGDVSITVLANANGGKSWIDCQNLISKQSSNSRLYLIENTSHNIHIDQPELIVEKALELIVLSEGKEYLLRDYSNSLQYR